jgi:hypothetical protein
MEHTRNMLYRYTFQKPSWTILRETTRNAVVIILLEDYMVSESCRKQSETCRLTLCEDLKIPYVREVIYEKYAKHHRKLETHPNPLLHPLLDTGQPRRLKRTQPVDLLWGSRGSVIARGLIVSLEECSALLLLAH